MSAATMKKPQHLVVCIGNEGYPASLEPRKIYVSVRDAEAEKKKASINPAGSGDYLPEFLK